MTQINLEGKIVNEFACCRALLEKIMDTNPQCRDMDDDSFKDFVKEYCIKNNLGVPKSETIRRTRQKIQNTLGKYPMSPEVKKARMEKENAIRKNIKYI